MKECLMIFDKTERKKRNFYLSGCLKGKKLLKINKKQQKSDTLMPERYRSFVKYLNIKMVLR